MALTQERLKELLSYSPETGLFYWRKSRGRVRAGAQAGCVCSDGYIRLRVDGVMYLAQRLTWFYIKGDWPRNLVDHENRIRSDNCWTNLRESTKSENARNALAHADAGSQFKGVSLTTSGRWAARICVNGEHKHLGNYDTPEIAAAAYDAAARDMHGEFARLNEAA